MSATDSMRAAAAAGARRIDLGERPLPTCGPGEVRVRVEACGICGSDLHFFHSGALPAGQTPGHEMAGRIDALGEGVSDLEIGTRVAVEPIRSCGQCETCRSGRHNICRATRLLGVHDPGGFAEYVAIPADRAHPIASSLDAPVAALTEPVAVAIHGLERGRIEPGQRVLIQGAGAIGLVSIVAARALGAADIWISARYDHQAALARDLGADRVLSEQESSRSALAALGAKHDIDLVLETVGGSADTLPAACAAIRPGGTVSVLGLFFGPVELDATILLVREGTLAWSNCYGIHPGPVSDFARAARLVEDERERLARLVTHTYALDEIGPAFELAADKRAGPIKVSVVQP